MQLTVVAIGQRMPAWVNQAWSEYARRFPRTCGLDLREIPMAKRTSNSEIERLRKREGELLLAGVPDGFRTIALDETGRQWSTLELADEMRNWMMEERGVSFLVGGPDGLSAACRRRAQTIWSLGRLTLPHPLVRVVLAEQLYRSWSVTQNHPYHRA